MAASCGINNEVFSSGRTHRAERALSRATSSVVMRDISFVLASAVPESAGKIVRGQKITTSSNLWRLFSRRLAATPICITIPHHSAAAILHMSRKRLYDAFQMRRMSHDRMSLFKTFLYIYK